MIDVTSVKKLGDYRLEIGFSDGTCGVRDFADIVARKGEMVQIRIILTECSSKRGR